VIFLKLLKTKVLWISLTYEPKQEKFMKHILTILPALLIFLAGQSQEISRSVKGTSGGSYASGGNSMDFVIGEPVTANYANASYILTQGFIQGNMIITSVEPEANVDIQVWPNPVGSSLHVQYDASRLQTPVLTVYNSNGRVLEKKQAMSDQLTMDFSAYQSGVYVLEITDGSERVKTIQLIKQ